MKQDEKINKAKELTANLSLLNRHEFEKISGIIEGLLMAKALAAEEAKQPA